jgi:branched-chain amino acid transport system ATP-binding protein
VAEPLLAVDRVSCWFGGLKAVDGASLSAPRGRITALIGPNGAGKTTLFSIISGFVRAREGVIRYAGEEITGKLPHELARLGIARTFQIVQPFVGLSVRENILVGAHLHHRARDAALAVADKVGRDLGLTDMLDRPADTLTVAARKRLELARALATEPALLLLDEVMAGLNATETERIVDLVRAINARGVGILLIEHVMRAVMSLSRHIVVIDHGERIAEGPPHVVANDPRVVEAYLGEADAGAAPA